MITTEPVVCVAKDASESLHSLKGAAPERKARELREDTLRCIAVVCQAADVNEAGAGMTVQ